MKTPFGLNFIGLGEANELVENAQEQFSWLGELF